MKIWLGETLYLGHLRFISDVYLICGTPDLCEYAILCDRAPEHGYVHEIAVRVVVLSAQVFRIIELCLSGLCISKTL